VIVITERTGRLVQHNFVEYRGVRFAILLGTARQHGAWPFILCPISCRKRGQFSERAKRQSQQLAQ